MIEAHNGVRCVTSSSLVERYSGPQCEDKRQKLADLSRRGWAWEFLRRNPEYAAAFALSVHRDPAKWGLLHFSHPAVSASDANVFWRLEVSDEVLPMAFVAEQPLPTSVALDLENLSCRIAFASDPEAGRRDILLSQDGRFLQLAIFGDGDIHAGNLMVPALADPRTVMSRTASLRRLNDLLFHKAMRAELYPPEGRAARLTKVLSALDGWLAQNSQRDIAIHMFGKPRVDDQWNDPRGHLRDQVRRAIAHGRELMTGGYRQFLQLTFARRIAAR